MLYKKLRPHGEESQFFQIQLFSSQLCETEKKKMFKVAFVVFAFVAVASAVIRPCNRGALGPQPLNHRITGCPDSSRTCRIVRGQDIAGELDFEASEFDKLIVVSMGKVQRVFF